MKVTNDQKILKVLIDSLLVFLFFIIMSRSLNSQFAFETFTVEEKQDYFLEFKVIKSEEYSLYLADTYNNENFSTDFSLKYCWFSIYRADKVTQYKDIYTEPNNNGGFTPESNSQAAKFTAMDEVVYVLIKPGKPHLSGTIGLYFTDKNFTKYMYKTVESPLNKLHKDSIVKYQLDEFTLKDNETMLLTFKVTPGFEYMLYIVDDFNNFYYSTKFTMTELSFAVLNSEKKVITGIYSQSDKNGGFTPVSDKPAAQFIAKENTLYLYVKAYSSEYTGSFGIKLIEKATKKVLYTMEKNPVLQINMSQFPLDTVTINEKFIMVKCNVTAGAIYKIFLVDQYNNEFFKTQYTLKEVWFQVQHSLSSIPYLGIYANPDNDGGITPESEEAASTFTSNEDVVYIQIKAYSETENGTVGFAIVNENNEKVTYEIVK